MKPRWQGPLMPDEVQIRSRLHDAQPEMALERIEVTVAMQKFMAFNDTECRDYGVDGFANGNAARAQCPVIPRGRNCDFTASHREKLERLKVPAGAMKIEVRSESLQD